MLSLTAPSESIVIRNLLSAKSKPFSYDSPGVTGADEVPSGFDSDRQRVLLGYGRRSFERAKQAITQWKMFDHAMTTLYWPDRPIERGAAVAVSIRVGPLWSLNPCRIVYTIDEPTRFGFAYGTLPGHIESGEERFMVEWLPADDSVWYEIHAVSRPSHVVTYFGYPIARLEQARFRRLSGEAMQRAVSLNEPIGC